MSLRTLETAGALAVVMLVSGCSITGRPGPVGDPDADVRDFRIGALSAQVGLMAPGVDPRGQKNRCGS
jgi:hypothetical protein